MSLLKEIKADNTQKVLELLQSPQDLTVKDKKGNSLIHMAIDNANMIILKALINSNPKPDLNAFNNDGVPPVSFAIEMNQIDAVLELLKGGAKVSCLAEGDNYSPLQFAAKYNIPEAAKILLRHHADSNYSNKDGTALHIAVRENSQEAAFVLLESEDVDMAATDDNGDTFLHLAVKQGFYGVIQKLFQMTEENKKLGEQLKDILNIQNKNGNTLLHLAEKDGKDSISNFLRTKGVEFGLDITIKNNKGMTVDEEKEKYKKELDEEDENKKAEQDIITEKKLQKKTEKDETELTNELFEQKKKELEEITIKKIEEAAKMNKTNPYYCLAIVIVLFSALYFYFDYHITLKQNNYLDL